MGIVLQYKEIKEDVMHKTGSQMENPPAETAEKRAFLLAANEVRLLETLLKSAKERREKAAEAAGY
jgi:hypothetical protein